MGQEIQWLFFIGTVGFLLGLFFALGQHMRYRIVLSRFNATRDRLEEHERRCELLTKENFELVQRVAHLKAGCDALVDKLEGKKEEAKLMEEQLLLRFKELSSDLLERKSEKFSKQNREQIEGLLLPLRENLTAFQNQIAATQRSSREEALALKEEFGKVNALYEKMSEESAKATRAIMGDSKLQGTWGEVHAIQILESTGLRKGEQFFVQKGFSALDGKRYIPDIIIKLPGERNIVMDVKVSLIDYVKFFNAEEEKEKELYLKKHLASIKNHVKNLSQKNYAQAYQLSGLDFVLLLLPVEPAFNLAIQQEPSLFHEAYERNIVLVSPTTLRATLAIIEHVWRDTHRNQYALEIAQQGGALYDKFVLFVEDLKKVGAQITMGQKSYEAAMKKLCEGRGNLVSKVEKLREMGVRSRKNTSVLSGGGERRQKD